MLEPAPAVIARVKRKGDPVAGADVLVILADGRRISATTGGDGRARLAGVPDGERTIYAWAPGMRPGSAETTVRGGAADADITLVEGEVASANLESHRMTPDEVRAAGIDPDAPGNHAVYSFEAHILDRRRDPLALRQPLLQRHLRLRARRPDRLLGRRRWRWAAAVEAAVAAAAARAPTPTRASRAASRCCSGS